MSLRVKWAALWTILGAFATFGLIVVAVDRFEDQLIKINWSLVVLISLFAFAAAMIYRWNDQLSRYNVIELVMNPKTGKPDPYRHLLWLFAGLTVWAIVQVVYAKAWDKLDTLLLGALGFFVAKPAIDGFSEAIASRPPAADSGPVQVNAPNADTVTVPQPVQPAPAEAATDIEPKPRRGKR